MILIDGQKPFDITPKETVEQRIELAKNLETTYQYQLLAQMHSVFSILKSHCY